MAITLAAYNDLGTDFELSAPAPAAKPVLQRLSDWLNSRAQLDRDAAITAFLAKNGGLLTDEVEREISIRFGGMAG